MNIFNKINIPIFFVAFAFGLFMCYLSLPIPKIIIKYPSPDTEDTIYTDDSEACYKYCSEEIDCPKDKKKIKDIPIQQTIFM